jgi:hypothetical protein
MCVNPYINVKTSKNFQKKFNKNMSISFKIGLNYYEIP